MAELTYKTNDVLTADLLTAQHIDAKHLANERDLMHSCWWEYRGEHPMNRTRRFAAHYIEMSQRFHGKYRNMANAQYVSGLYGGDNIFPRVTDNDAGVTRKKANLTGLWKARQAADELGISYSIYLAPIFEKTASMGWSYMPRPVQLYSGAMKMLALDEQVKEIERYIPDFTNENLKVGSTAPFKQDFDNWLFELGSLRRMHVEMAFDRMAELGYITATQAVEWTERVQRERAAA